MRVVAEGECLRIDFPVRRAGERFRAASGRAVLSVFVSGTAAARDGAELRGGRGVGSAAGNHWLHPGDGNFEAGAGAWNFVGGKADVIQRARHEVSGSEVAARSSLPNLRGEADDQGIDRL